MQVAITLMTGLIGALCIAVMLRRLPWKAKVPAPEPGPRPAEQ
jgi:hypothetical protein